MNGESQRSRVLCLTASRSLNKRMSLFVEGALSSVAAVQIWSLPRGRWTVSRFESPPDRISAGRMSLWCGERSQQRLIAVFCFHWIMLPLAVVIGTLRRIPIVYDEHDHYEINTTERTGRPLLRSISRTAVRCVHRLCLPQVTLVTCIHLANAELKRHLARWQPNVLELHNYPVSAWRSQPTRRSSNDPLHFVYMGGVYAEKGVRQAADAWRALPDAVRNHCQLQIFGDGDPALIAELQDSPGLVVHASVSPEQLRSFAATRRCCGLVLYNQHPRYRLIGTNSRKLYEYLALGMPVIATDVGELAEFVRASEVGIVIDSRMIPGELTQAMQTIGTSESGWQEYSRRAAELMARPEMSWEHEWNKVLAAGVFPPARSAA